eukprot:scaffold507327_cov43-Prasinocladus_malaysianus.AAC.1
MKQPLTERINTSSTYFVSCLTIQLRCNSSIQMPILSTQNSSPALAAVLLMQGEPPLRPCPATRCPPSKYIIWTGWTRMQYFGLEEARPGWTNLNWTGLDWTSLHWVGLNCTGLDRDGLDWT